MKWYYWAGIAIVVGLVGYLTYQHFTATTTVVAATATK